MFVCNSCKKLKCRLRNFANVEFPRTCSPVDESQLSVKTITLYDHAPHCPIVVKVRKPFKKTTLRTSQAGVAGVGYLLPQPMRVPMKGELGMFSQSRYIHKKELNEPRLELIARRLQARTCPREPIVTGEPTDASRDYRDNRSSTLIQRMVICVHPRSRTVRISRALVNPQFDTASVP